MTKETPRSNPWKKIVKKLRNATLITALWATLLTWASSCESNSWESKRNPSTEMHKWTYILTEEEKLEYEKLDERLDELSKKALRYFVDRTADDGTAVNMSIKYNIPIVYPFLSKEGIIQKLAIIEWINNDSIYENLKNTTNGWYIPYEGSKNTTIFPYRSSYSTRPIISKNDHYTYIKDGSSNFEEFNLSPEEYKRALDLIEEILNKEEEVIGNAVNDFIDSNLQ